MMRWAYYFIHGDLMINLKSCYLLILTYIVCGSAILGQSENRRSFSLQFNIQHQDIPIDLDVGELQTIHKVYVRPYFSADFQYNFNQSDKKSKFITAHVGYYYNPYNSRWLATNIGYGTRIIIFNRFAISPSFELGIGFARDQTIQYTFENEKWNGQSRANILTYEFIAKTRLDLLYTIHPKIDLLLSSHGMIISDEDLILLPYYGLGFGLRYTL